MDTNIDLKEVERKIFSSYFNDGMWDIYGGLILLGFGLSMLTGEMLVMIICIALAMIPLLVRKPMIMARLGSVRFSPQRQAKTKKSKIATMIVLTFTLLLGILFFALYSTNTLPGWLEIWMGDYFLIVFGCMLAVMVAAAAYLSEVKRFYSYALLVLIAFVMASVLRAQDMEGVPITTAGGLVLAAGIIILVRFLTLNPVHGEKTD